MFVLILIIFDVFRISLRLECFNIFLHVVWIDSGIISMLCLDTFGYFLKLADLGKCADLDAEEKKKERK